MQLSKSYILYIVLQLCLFSSNVYCDEAGEFDDAAPSTQKLESINSFFYLSTEENLDSPSVQAKPNEQFFTKIQPYGYKEEDERNNQEAIFYKRLVAMLLLKLVKQRVGDRLIGTFSVEASPSQLEYLQNFINGQGSIREVDRILESVIKPPQYSTCHYMAEMSHYFNLLTEHLTYYLSVMKKHWDITVILFIVICSFMILRRQRFSRGLVIFLSIDVIFIISFFITWWRLVQEAEIKLMAAQAQFAEMPIACQPHKMGIWDKMIASVWSTNDCEKYYETLMTNPRLQVTPAYALTYFLSTTIFQPLSYLGLVISEFIDNATSKLNIFYKFPIVITLFLSFCICIVLIPFSLIGGSINLGIGPFFKFGMKGRTKAIERPEYIDRIYENTSSQKRLEGSEKIKQITLTQDNDPAGGDAHHADEKCGKCVASDDEKEKKEKGDGDC